MAISCDPNDLAIAAKCFNGGFGAPLLKAIRIRLLCGFLNGETMICDPNSLAIAATCYVEGLSQGQLDAIETYLVCQVANGGGGGGGGGQLVPYTVAPPANPTNTAQPAFAYDPTGILPSLGWNTSSLTWN